MVEYVAVDLEMTGLRARTDRILEIGAVKVQQGEITDFFQTLVNPQMKLPEEIISLTGITDQMAAKGCDTYHAVQEFLTFCRGFPLAGHNIIFDYSFLKQYAINQGIPLEKEGVDTLKLARKFLPEAEKKTLDYLCEFLHIRRERTHRALEDARAAAKLLEYLKMQFGEREPEAFLPKPLQYKAKKQQPATKQQKSRLQELVQYYQINLNREIESLNRSEASRLTDQIYCRYGKIPRS
ncbi:3'-5' exonuclease [Lachnospiraceae bacterium]|nr:3'-5' exonuclease [Lachnospiraceae bacterium]